MFNPFATTEAPVKSSSLDAWAASLPSTIEFVSVIVPLAKMPAPRELAPTVALPLTVLLISETLPTAARPAPGAKSPFVVLPLIVEFVGEWLAHLPLAYPMALQMSDRWHGDMLPDPAPAEVE